MINVYNRCGSKSNFIFSKIFFVSLSNLEVSHTYLNTLRRTKNITFAELIYIHTYIYIYIYILTL